MERDIKKIFEKSKQISLGKNEKADIGRILSSYAETNPVRKSATARLNMQRSQKYALKIKTMPIILALVLFVSGGTAIAAEGSLPGDFLYPVKTEVSEEVRGWFAVDAEAKANFHAKIAEERLEETEELAVRGELREELRTQLEELFEARVTAFEEHIAELEASGRTEAAAELGTHMEAMLEAHDNILDALDSGEALPMVLRVRARLHDVIQNRADSEAEFRGRADVDIKTAVEGAMTAAENKIAEVRRFLDNNEEKLGADVFARAEARLELAEDTFAEGKVKLTAGEYADAFVLFHQAMRIAQEARLIAAAHIRLNFDEDVMGRIMFRFNGDDESDSSVDENSDVEDSDSETNSADDSDDDESNDNSDVNVDGDVDVDVDDDSIDVDLNGSINL